MGGIYQEFGATSRNARIERHINRGRFVPNDMLIALLLSDETLSDCVRTYMAERLAGKNMRPVGQPRDFFVADDQSSLDRLVEAIDKAKIHSALNYMKRLKLVWKKRYNRKTNVSDFALKKAADKYGFAEEYLRNQMRRSPKP